MKAPVGARRNITKTPERIPRSGDWARIARWGVGGKGDEALSTFRLGNDLRP